MNRIKFLGAVTMVFFTLLHADSELMVNHFNRATELLRQNKIDEAISCYSELIEHFPECQQAYYNVSIAYEDKNDLAKAREMLNKALTIDPAYAKAYIMLGEIDEKENNKEQALVHYRQGLFLKPNDAKAHHALARIYCEQSKFDLSVKEYREALQYDENNPSLMMDYGNALTMAQMNEEALALFLKLHDLRPGDMNVYYNIAYCYKRLDMLNQAIEVYQNLLEKRPDNMNARYGLGTALLARASCDDDWLKGWEGYESRFDQSNLHRRTYEGKKIWDGSRLDDQILYLIAEQGLGDTFQCIRFARIAKEIYGARIVVSVQRPLVKLLSLCPYLDKVIELDKQPAYFDTYAHIMSLPHILKTVEKTIPADVPYLFADPALVASWEKELVHDTNFRIGLCWQGNPNYSTHFLRTAVAAKSVTPTVLAPLAAVPGVSFYSLQKDHATNVDDHIPDSFNVVTFNEDFDQANGRFMDTAAVMKNMNLIITVDTSIAHLAGGLGIPVWVILPAPADWRWMLAREDTPWYPTMRLFRQKKAGEWASVISEICVALQELVLSQKVQQ